MAQGRFGQAEDYLTQALQLDLPPDQAAPAHALLGRLLLDDDQARASHHFQQAGDEDMLNVLLATSESGSDPAGRSLLLGVALLQRGELTLAHRQFERAIAGDPNDAEAHAYLAHTLDRMGETVAAGELLDRAQALDPDSALAYYFSAAHHRRVGNINDAQAALWEALLRDPENAALHVEMAETLVDLGDYPGAEKWYQDAVELAPDDVEFQLLLARFYLDHLYRVEEGGLPAAQTAANLSPEDPRSYDLLGWAYHLAGRQVEGRLALGQALELDPELVSALYHLGSLNATIDQQQLACQYLQRTVDLDTGGYYRNRAAAVMVDLGCREETRD
jgi:Flp pilus assembly protein TadD